MLFILSIKATARALMEVVIFRTRHERSGREGGIPQGIHKGIEGSQSSSPEDSHEHIAEPILGPIPR